MFAACLFSCFLQALILKMPKTWKKRHQSLAGHVDNPKDLVSGRVCLDTMLLAMFLGNVSAKMPYHLPYDMHCVG